MNRPLKKNQQSSGQTRSPSLVEQTIDVLGRDIINGTYAPNESLPPEVEIARAIGVGRNVVREATKILTSVGLLRIAQGSGTKVQPVDQWNYLDQRVIGWAMDSDDLRDDLIDELSTLRLIVEPEVAAIAAQTASTTEILRLFEAFEEMEKNRDIPEQAVEADILFHRRLFAAAHNKFLTAILRTVVVVLRANFALAIKADYHIIEFLEEHRQVAEAINRRDPDAARAAMRLMLTNNEQHLIDMRKAVAERGMEK